MAAHRLTSVTFNGKELVRYDYDGYGDLTAVYGLDGKKNCAVSPTATTSWSNTVSPTDWYPATNTTVTTPTAKCSRVATTSVKNGRSTTAKTKPSLPTYWDGRQIYLYLHRSRQLRTFGAGTQPHQCRRRKPPTNLLLPLRQNRHPT